MSYDRSAHLWTTNPTFIPLNSLVPRHENITLDSVMSSGTCLLTKTDLSNRQIYIIINNQPGL